MFERPGRKRLALRRGARACQHFIEDAAERINIGARVGGLAFALLRRHVRQRAHHHTAASETIVAFPGGQSEVENLGARFRQHDVAGLQIAMDDPALMRVGEGVGDLRGVTERLIHLQWTAFQSGRDGLAFKQLHHQIVGANVVESADVRMIER